MTNLQVTYSVNGLLGPMTDDITVPDQYTDTDIKSALEVILADCSKAMDRHISLRHVLLVKQQ
jgi:hypothetical protein